MEHNIAYAYCPLPTSKPRAATILHTIALGHHGDRRELFRSQQTCLAQAFQNWCCWQLGWCPPPPPPHNHP